MRESIDHKVVLHDHNLRLFSRHFIKYLYSGQLNEYDEDSNDEDNHDNDTKKTPKKTPKNRRRKRLTNDDLIELLTFADKYEVINH